MWYYVQKIRDENGAVVDHKVLGVSHNPFAVKPDHENVFDTVERDPTLTRVALDENDQPVLDEMGFLTLEDDTDAIAAKELESEIELRVKRISFGQRLIAIMSIRNDAKDLTPSEIVELVATFQTINTAWLNGSIATSRALIAALTPDETILTTADKTAILAEIDANLASLGYE